MNVVVMDGRLRFGEWLVVSFHRTLRVPGQGGPYKLPPGLGLFAIKAIADERFIVPVHSREAVWIGFSAAPWKPNAVKVVAGGINAVSGLPDDGTALLQPQNYMVCPDQPWLDGCNVGGGVVRQFVAKKLGLAYGLGATTVAGERGGLDILGFEPRPGLCTDTPPPPSRARGCRGSRWTVNGVGTHSNDVLSTQDRAFIASVYPKPAATSWRRWARPTW